MGEDFDHRQDEADLPLWSCTGSQPQDMVASSIGKSYQGEIQGLFRC